MSNLPTISAFAYSCSRKLKNVVQIHIEDYMIYSLTWQKKMVKLFQMLQGDAEYFGLLLMKSSDPQSYPNGHKRGIFTSVYYEIPNICAPRMVSQL